MAVKLNGDTVTHKTEGGVVRLGLASPDQVAEAAAELLAGVGEGADLLVTQMVTGHRELIAGLVHDIGHGPFSHLFDDCFIQEICAAGWSHELQSCRVFGRIIELFRGKLFRFI